MRSGSYCGSLFSRTGNEEITVQRKVQLAPSLDSVSSLSVPKSVVFLIESFINVNIRLKQVPMEEKTPDMAEKLKQGSDLLMASKAAINSLEDA